MTSERSAGEGKQEEMAMYAVDYRHLVCSDCSLAVKIHLDPSEARCSRDCRSVPLEDVVENEIPDSWREE